MNDKNVNEEVSDLRNGGATRGSYPAKDEIIARLVQLREYTEKAEEALNALPPGSSEAKLRQLQEMTAEMRTTEKRLMEALREYDVDEHTSSSHCEDNAQLLAERNQLEQKCHESQERIATLEEERKFLLQLCAQEDAQEKYNNLTDDSRGDSRRSNSTERILLAEDLVQAQRRGGAASNSEKRYEIHNIISEIALLRRAKDESARKIDMLQQALDTGDLKNYKVSEASVSAVSHQEVPPLGKSTDEFGADGDSPGGVSNGSVLMEHLQDQFALSVSVENISQKLMEVQLMREKLDALQNLVHNLPTPGTALDNEVAMASSGAAFSGNVEKEISHPVQIQKPFPRMPMQNSFSDRDLKRLLTEHESPTGFVPYNPRSGKHESSVGTSAIHKPTPVQYSHHLDHSGSLRNGMDNTYCDKLSYGDHGFKQLAMSGTPYDGRTDFDRRDESLLGNRRNMGTESNRDNESGWMLFSSSPRSFEGGNRTRIEASTAGIVEKYVTESNALLKHICSSVSSIHMQLNDHKKQLNTIQETLEKVLYNNNNTWYGSSSDNSRLYNRSRLESVRASCENATLSSKPCSLFVPNELRDNSAFGPTTIAGLNCDLHGLNTVKRGHVVRDIWNSLETASNGTPSHPSNLTNAEADGCFYAPGGSTVHKVSRPWVSPPMDGTRYMLNNQVPPGNRTNNYWDNFRSQSRQNVFPSNGKSNEAYNSLPAISPDVFHAQTAAAGTNNMFQNAHARHDKNPGAKPLRGVMMKHFVENIGSKKRNHEQQRKLVPQRSVSVGSMHSASHPLTLRHNEIPSPTLRRFNDIAPLGSNSQSHKHSIKSPSRAVNLQPKEPNVREDSARDTMGDLFGRVSLLEESSHRKLVSDFSDSFMGHSSTQDGFRTHGNEALQLRLDRDEQRHMSPHLKTSPSGPRSAGNTRPLTDAAIWADIDGSSRFSQEDIMRQNFLRSLEPMCSISSPSYEGHDSAPDSRNAKSLGNGKLTRSWGMCAESHNLSSEPPYEEVQQVQFDPASASIREAFPRSNPKFGQSGTSTSPSNSHRTSDKLIQDTMSITQEMNRRCISPGTSTGVAEPEFKTHLEEETVEPSIRGFDNHPQSAELSELHPTQKSETLHSPNSSSSRALISSVGESHSDIDSISVEHFRINIRDLNVPSPARNSSESIAANETEVSTRRSESGSNDVTSG